MRALVVLVQYLFVMIARLFAPGGARLVVGETLLVEHGLTGAYRLNKRMVAGKC